MRVLYLLRPNNTTLKQVKQHIKMCAAIYTAKEEREREQRWKHTCSKKITCVKLPQKRNIIA